MLAKVLPKERDHLRPRISVCKCIASGGTSSTTSLCTVSQASRAKMGIR